MLMDLRGNIVDVVPCYLWESEELQELNVVVDGCSLAIVAGPQLAIVGTVDKAGDLETARAVRMYRFAGSQLLIVKIVRKVVGGLDRTRAMMGRRPEDARGKRRRRG